jgi:hypothetical protein
MGVLQIPWIAARLYENESPIEHAKEFQDIGKLIRRASDGGIKS